MQMRRQRRPLSSPSRSFPRRVGSLRSVPPRSASFGTVRRTPSPHPKRRPLRFAPLVGSILLFSCLPLCGFVGVGEGPAASSSPARGAAAELLGSLPQPAHPPPHMSRLLRVPCIVFCSLALISATVCDALPPAPPVLDVTVECGGLCCWAAARSTCRSLFSFSSPCALFSPFFSSFITLLDIQTRLCASFADAAVSSVFRGAMLRQLPAVLYTRDV